MVAEGVRRISRGRLPRPSELLLTPANAARVAERLSRLRGAAMKVGQLLSMEAGDLLPPELVQVLSRLRADAHPMPMSQLVTVLNDAWGEGWDQRLRRFSFTPMAAASIGQVHGAETATGRPLAVKIQYPGVRQSIDSDVDNVALLLRSVRGLPEALDVKPLLDEAKRQLHEEADYLREARYLLRYRDLVANDPAFVLPDVEQDLTTADVLAMTRLVGTPVENAVNESSGVRDLIATRLLRLFLRELFEFGVIQTDPNFANFLFDASSGRIGLLDFGATRDYSPERVGSYRRLFRAGLRADRAALESAAVEIGYFGEGDDRIQRKLGIDLMLSAFEPARHRGSYDFGASNLAPRIRELGMTLSLEHGFWRAPPPDTAFLHRKLGGLFLLFVRLRARVDVRGLFESHLG
jgi:predicted unusual protein kinase regulating ubiquinone biosynthesis (AarF/ABC1/UbiB family)